MPDPLEGLLKIDRSSALATIKVLTRAFWRYPATMYFFPEESNRYALSDNVMALPVYTGLRYGEVYATSEKFEGAAVWIDSASFPLSFWKILRSMPLRYIWGMRKSGDPAMQAFDNYINEIHKRRVPYRHYYLELLGVDPHCQSQGFASKLIKPMLKRLDTEGKTCYLKTQDKQDVPVYLHFGFSVIDESVIPDTPLRNWAMLRKPQC